MNRNTIMKFRATEEEASEIRRKAVAAGMTVSRFLRTSAMNSQVVLYNTADLFGLRYELRGVVIWLMSSILQYIQLRKLIWNIFSIPTKIKRWNTSREYAAVMTLKLLMTISKKSGSLKWLPHHIIMIMRW